MLGCTQQYFLELKHKLSSKNTFQNILSLFNCTMELTGLPNEIIVKIFHHLSIEDLGSWTTVSKRFRHICLDRALPYGKMKNVFKKDMSTKELEDSLANKIRMIRKLKNINYNNNSNVLVNLGKLITTLKNPNFNNTHQLNQQIKNILKANPSLMSYIVEERCQQLIIRQKQQGHPGPAGQPGQAGGSNQSLPTMQSLQQLITALKSPIYNTQQQQQLVVVNILKASPAQMIAFLKQKKRQELQLQPQATTSAAKTTEITPVIYDSFLNAVFADEKYYVNKSV